MVWVKINEIKIKITALLEDWRHHGYNKNILSDSVVLGGRTV